MMEKKSGVKVSVVAIVPAKEEDKTEEELKDVPIATADEFRAHLDGPHCSDLSEAARTSIWDDFKKGFVHVKIVGDKCHVCLTGAGLENLRRVAIEKNSQGHFAPSLEEIEQQMDVAFMTRGKNGLRDLVESAIARKCGGCPENGRCSTQDEFLGGALEEIEAIDELPSLPGIFGDALKGGEDLKN
jgi:hypothetical protein